MYLFELEFSLGICPGVGLLDHMIVLFLFFFLLKNSIYLFMAVLGLHCCKQAFSSCGEQVLPSSCNAQRCLLLWNMGSGLKGSVVVAHRLQLRLIAVVAGLAALKYVGSSQARDQTCVPCIGRWILHQCTTKEVPFLVF